MKLTPINGISFMKTCDVHTHKGHWWVNTVENTPGAVKDRGGNYKVLKDLSCDIFQVANGALSTEENRVEKVFISNLDCMVTDSPDIVQGKAFLKNETDGNMELLNKCTNPNEYLYATGQPGIGNAQNLEKVIENTPEKFVGIKLHPSQLGIPADDALYEPYMELARKKKLPVLFHSQALNDSDLSHPERIYKLAKKYPDVPVILGHTCAGGEKAHNAAIRVIEKSLVNKDALLYADVSWMDFSGDLPSDNPKSILKLIKTLKKNNALNRVMFGSDVPVGNFGEKQVSEGKYKSSVNPAEMYNDMQNKIKKAIRKDRDLKAEADKIINDLFYNNAEKLFFSPPQKKHETNTLKLGKSALTVGGLALAASAFVVLNHNKNSAQKSE